MAELVGRPERVLYRIKVTCLSEATRNTNLWVMGENGIYPIDLKGVFFYMPKEPNTKPTGSQVSVQGDPHEKF